MRTQAQAHHQTNQPTTTTAAAQPPKDLVAHLAHLALQSIKAASLAAPPRTLLEQAAQHCYGAITKKAADVPTTIQLGSELLTLPSVPSLTQNATPTLQATFATTDKGSNPLFSPPFFVANQPHAAGAGETKTPIWRPKS